MAAAGSFRTRPALRPARAAATKPAAAKAAKLAWPKSLPEQAQAVRAALAGRTTPASAEDVARAFKGAKLERVRELLETLGALGQIRRVDQHRFAA